MKDIDMSLIILKNDIQKIRTVSEWAEAMGYANPKYFARIFRREFGLGAKEALVKVRVNCWLDCIARDPEQKNYCTAQLVGLKDEVALNKYIKKYTGKTPTQLKRKVGKSDYFEI